MMRKILSVVAGFMTWTVLWLGSNAALTAAFPGEFREDGSTGSTGILIVILAYSALYSVVAGVVAGKIALDWGKTAALITGVLLLAVGLAVQSQYWHTAPVWYHLVFLGVLLPGSVLGGRLVGGGR
jgi:hypothetical protein